MKLLADPPIPYSCNLPKTIILATHITISTLLLKNPFSLHPNFLPLAQGIKYI